MYCDVPIEKFRDYIFKPGATHGKDHVFRSLGYGQQNSAELAALYERQATAKFASSDYILGRRDEHGQRIDIEIELTRIAVNAQGEIVTSTSHLRSGWMIQTDGGIRLNTPFSGFTR